MLRVVRLLPKVPRYGAIFLAAQVAAKINAAFF